MTRLLAGRLSITLVAIAILASVAAQPSRAVLTEAAPSGPAATASPAAYLPVVYNRTVQIFRDNFSNPASGWLVVDNASVALGYTNGEYSTLVKPVESVIWTWNNATWADGFRVEADARSYSSTDGLYGIAFGASGGNAYLFLAGNGTYELQRYDSSVPQFVSLVPPQTSPYVFGGNQTNRLKVVRNGASISLYANGHLLTSASDSTYGSGYVGVTTWARTSNYEARYDNFLLVFDPNNTTASGVGIGIAIARSSGRPGRLQLGFPALKTRAWDTVLRCYTRHRRARFPIRGATQELVSYETDSPGH